jgi:hypothetical protein
MTANTTSRTWSRCQQPISGRSALQGPQWGSVNSWIWLRRWWRAWSSAPPPPELQALLDALAQGYPLPFYDSS